MSTYLDTDDNYQQKCNEFFKNEQERLKLFTEQHKEFIEKQDYTNETQIFIPKEFLCPITSEIFVDPVIGYDGVTYESYALLEQENKLTRFNVRDPKDIILRSNTSLKRVIDMFISNNKDIQDYLFKIEILKIKKTEKSRLVALHSQLINNHNGLESKYKQVCKDYDDLKRTYASRYLLEGAENAVIKAKKEITESGLKNTKILSDIKKAEVIEIKASKTLELLIKKLIN